MNDILEEWLYQETINNVDRFDVNLPALTIEQIEDIICIREQRTAQRLDLLEKER